MHHALAFFGGVLLLQGMPRLPQLQEGLLLLLLSAVLLFVLWRLAGSRLLWLGLVPLGFVYAALYASWGLSQPLPQPLERQDLLAVGRLVNLPVEYDRRSRFEFEIESLQHQGRDIDFKARVRLSWYGKERPRLRAGERWQLLVRLKRPHGFANPGGFDYQAWLWQQGIRATGYVRPSNLNQRLQQDAAGPVPRWRQHLAEQLEAALPTDARALIAALTLGERAGFSQAQWQVFRETGTNHLVAISGLHVGMVAGLLLLLVAWLWRRSARLCLLWPAPRAAALAALVGAAFYAAMAGFSIPTQRALVMLAALLLPVLLGRRNRPWQGLALALFVVLLLNPVAVLSPGFILSFAAVAAILWALDRRAQQESWAWTLLRMQFAVLLVISPLLILLFNQASLLAFPVNLVAVPWFSFVLVPLAFLGLVLLLLLPPLGAWLLQGVAPLYRFSLEALEWAAAVGPGLLELGERPLPLVLLACLGGLWLLSPLRLPARYLGLLLLAPLGFWQPARPAAGQFELNLLDVGQGLAVVVQTQGHVLVYDTGPAFSADFNAGSAVLVPFLKHRGIRHIDRLLISHSAQDHQGGLDATLAALRVGLLLGPAPLQAGASRAGMPIHPCQAGETWRWDGVEFRVLHPPPGSLGEDNDSSCVLLVQAGAAKLILTGDLERRGERAVLQAHGADLAGAVVQVAHHGSRTSSIPAWVDSLRAPLALVASGYLNPFGQPHAEVVRRWRDSGAEVLNTADSGAIRVLFDPLKGVVDVAPWRQQQRRYWHQH